MASTKKAKRPRGEVKPLAPVGSPGGSSDTFTTEEAAREVALKVRTFARLQAAGLGPRPVRIGRLVRFRKAELERWLLAAQKEAVPMPPTEERWRRAGGA